MTEKMPMTVILAYKVVPAAASEAVLTTVGAMVLAFMPMEIPASMTAATRMAGSR